MFAPEPGRENVYMAARITYADGSVKLWGIGRQDTLPLWSRLVGEREHEEAASLDRKLYGEVVRRGNRKTNRTHSQERHRHGQRSLQHEIVDG